MMDLTNRIFYIVTTLAFLIMGLTTLAACVSVFIRFETDIFWTPLFGLISIIGIVSTIIGVICALEYKKFKE